LPFKSGTFAAAMTFSTLEHLWNPFLATSEVHRVLSENARFAGEAAFLEAMHDNSCFHMSPIGLEKCLGATGFQVESFAVRL
ncbi:unnamed protein product, partial [marine sediment metagenome]